MKRSLKNCRILSFVLMAHLAGSLRTLAESKSEPNLGLPCVSSTMLKHRRRPGTLPERLPQAFLVELESRHPGWNVRFRQRGISPFRLASNRGVVRSGAETRACISGHASAVRLWHPGDRCPARKRNSQPAPPFFTTGLNNWPKAELLLCL